MAMIQCRECGDSVSDSARACPKCGIDSPGGSCQIVISRPSIAGMAVRMSVYVDNAPYGDVKGRKSVSIPVSPGQHHVLVETSQGKAGTCTVNVTPGDPEQVNVGISKLTGGVKFS